MDSGFILLTLAIGTGLSLIFIDPPNSIHPVSWFGKLVSYFIPKLKNNNPKLEKLNGIIFSFTLVIGISLVSYYASNIIYKLFGILALMIFSISVLKFSMAILTLERHVQAITCNLKEENLDGARKNLSRIVGRQTDTLEIAGNRMNMHF